MTPEHLRTFARRDWAAASRRALGYWADRYHSEGSGPAWRASVQLLEHARRLGLARPDHPDRARDRTHHLNLCRLLDRASRAFTGR